MSFISELLSSAGIWVTKIISSLGYAGIFILMIFESMVVPIPSELVLPFAGFLAATGEFNIFLVILVASFGSLLGSLISYYIGLYGGNKLIVKYGKYFFVDLADLQKTEKWFAEKGEKTVFISRFIPVVRHLISIPAGIGKMNLKKFCIYTIAGAALWNAFLIYLGYLLGQRWNEVKHYSEYFTIPVIILLIVGGSYYIYHHIRNKQKNKKAEEELLKDK
ncbi:DedA family protein [Candidatus Woesearchaeota archaeon]|nr:DedA family protein [Candidatus Woesearchaeota archaeon]